ncbi:hypothetical protein M0Q97_11370 [Candidatus Dojkabacteria bacterium]|jgi:hypothetical protein|nr:hypothetical protein [Candidatus Dojkabacteria bacterium]
MSKEKNEAVKADGLEMAETAVETTTTTKKEKIQTKEEIEVIEAGMALVKKFGVSEKFEMVMGLAPFWNGDKEVLSTKKEEVIKFFGGSDKLKDFVDGEFQTELNGILGTAKVGSILNNVKSFYARRQSTGRTKYVQVNISNVIYNVDAEYYNSIGTLPKEEKRELILAHPGTKEVENTIEVL